MTDTNEQKWRGDKEKLEISHDSNKKLWSENRKLKERISNQYDLIEDKQDEITALKAELRAEQVIADYCLNLIAMDDEPTEEQCDKVWSLARSTVKNRRIVL